MLELHERQLLKGVKICKLGFCKFCVYGEQTKVSFKIAGNDCRSKGILDYIRSDMWGPSPVKSKGGGEYFVTFIDDFSRKVWVYFIKTSMRSSTSSKSGRKKLKIKQEEKSSI